MEAKKIAVLDSSILWKNKYFDYLLESEKLDIAKMHQENKSIIFGVLTEKQDFDAFFIIEFFSQSLHLRETCGLFIKNYKVIEAFLMAVAKKYEKTYITVTTTRTHKFLLKRLGFEFIDFEYRKKVI